MAERTNTGIKSEFSDKIHQILKTYWGYDAFRPLQEDIITAVLEGYDTLALLPTGGGKSLCFQVPAMFLEGVCVVVSPLIALMKDQVYQLKKRNINAVALYSGMSKREIDITLDNCAYGDVKFLYVSPERLKTDIFIARIKKMKVALLAIDEAHCISQWGYDFRPPYLEIALLREIIPQTPIIALTATATEIVKGDIQDKLKFVFAKKKVFQKSFARANLSYSTFYEENKNNRLVEILAKVQGSAVVYAGSRKNVKDISLFLQKKGISVDFYHAGLTPEERSRRQDAWIENKIRIIVATNAFGMGIDKPDVRLVVHTELPSTLEAYYQEAGRGGRDEKKAFAVALYDKNDIQNLEINILKSYPNEVILKKVYQSLANYLRIAVGSNLMLSYDFDLLEFCKNFSLEHNEAYFSLKILEQEGLLLLSEAFYTPSRMVFNLSGKELESFQKTNSRHTTILQQLLRMYGGDMYDNFIKISEAQIAKNINQTIENTVLHLEHLHKISLLTYEKQKNKPQITLLTERYESSVLPIDYKKIENKRDRDLRKAKWVADYAQHQNRCRTQLLLEYFGEISYEPCGVCDICIKKKKEKRLSETHYDKYRERILKALEYKSLIMNDLIAEVNPQTRDAFVEALQKIIEVGEIEYLANGKLKKV